MEKVYDSSTGQFIDPLFAIVIAAAVNETFVTWCKSDSLVNIMPNNLTEFLIVFAGYSNILLSWFGYHKSVAKKPIKSAARFYITVVLLPLYLFTIILYKMPVEYLTIVYFSIFLLWTIWEVIKNNEYAKESCENGRDRALFRSYNIFIFLAFLIAVGSLLYREIIGGSYDSSSISSVSQSILIVISIFWLRIRKSEGDSAFGYLNEAYKKAVGL
ncbi:hypothetical protein [Bowmanella denitrificans]|uniref:hypothetical protein n=1 Tax=Bowmanella denitrificans TaxID=366582 RepID=UPI000C99EBC7|nr:hypothetical protein [Bowmanella denitrificans]